MKLQSFVFAALATALVVEASNPLAAGHGRLARRSQPTTKRCKARTPPKADDSSASTGNSFAASNDNKGDSNNSGKANDSQANSNTDDNNKANNDGDKSSSDGNKGNSGGNKGNNSGHSSDGGILSGSFDISAIAGPNGDIDEFNRGIDGAGWNPPYLGINDIKVVDLADALSKSDSPFHACAPYVDQFYRYGGANNIPPIMLASFAMQESSCNPHTVGGAGEQGLMQLTHEKCVNAPNGDCQDPDYNIKTGAEYFARTLKDKGGDLLQAIGSYNGWFKGMTYSDATAAANTGCCRCQNNLDYLQQFLNGWCQNVNAYSMKLGKYFNLDRC
ncbi:hypothetical protein D9758_001899 [Tetrapyrgos nigripes]|uniref:Transglycosylase SLT domain-containing protein n=1 Tax=Tetrapyrgos nigripes TaxID=182062 RepID=A0A8H5GTP3_9AGAR|nr:hypothetical protein D9758_001899 [Tetrapyrgos nigripes]